MKIALVMLMCSSFHGCLEPFVMPTIYNNYYDCLSAGYSEAMKKQKEIGRVETNKHQIFIRFDCKEVNEI